MKEMIYSADRRSVLEELNVTEEQTYEICRNYGLLSPTYKHNTRGGCWFCPNSKISEFAELKKKHPELWQELKEMAKTPNLVSRNFKYSMTFEECEAKVDAIIFNEQNQLKIEV